MEAKLEVVRREVIKAASCPRHDDRLQLSLLDLSCPAIYVPTILFYESGQSPEIISEKLKTSLSETLSRFYPLAGRVEGASISCNGEGAVFTEARTDLLLSDFLRNNTNVLGAFLPEIAPGESAGTWPLLSVKVSFFGSGSGYAVTVAISHLISDHASLLTFVQGWAATANDLAAVTSSPQFAGTTIYPPPHSSFLQSPSVLDGLYDLTRKCATNRFVFKSSKIADLICKAASESVPVPTPVEAIATLLWICATNASRSNSVNAAKSTMMTQAMDLRLMVPSNVLSRDTVGNLQSSIFIKKSAESKMELGEIVSEFQKAKEEINKMVQENLNTAGTTTLGQNLLGVMGNFMSELKPDTQLYAMSSWCTKPFYEVDFGWGTPVWMGSALHTINDNMAFVLLLDSKDGEDVEAWVGLPEQDMSALVRDQDLLTYAVLNPPVLI